MAEEDSKGAATTTTTTTTTKTVILLVGFPASGKSTYARQLCGEENLPGHDPSSGDRTCLLSRDTNMGGHGRLEGLLSLLREALDDPEVTRIVLDNTHGTLKSRTPFVAAAQAAGARVEAHCLTTTFEDAQINALNRMWDRYGQVLLTADDIKSHEEARKDPNIFPPAALFSYRKSFVKPSLEEGFDHIVTVRFKREPAHGNRNKAVILDYDYTLRQVTAGARYKYPVAPDEIEILPNRTEVLRAWADKDYKLLGVSNQSGIAKEILTDGAARDCFEVTNQGLGQDIEYYYCPHRIPPVTCWCRKPQPGLGVMLIRKHQLDPSQCIYVGDQTTDKTFAKRCGFQFIDQSEFFRG